MHLDFPLFSAKFIGSFSAPNQMPIPNKPEFFFIGRSNSGKSSFLRALLKNPSIVKVSKNPGHTKTMNVFETDLCYFVDLPGYGYAKVSQKERNFMSEVLYLYLQSNRPKAAGFILHDIRRQLTEEELKLAHVLRESQIPAILLLTKADKLNQKELSKAIKNSKMYETVFHLIFPVSAKTRYGFNPVFQFLTSRLGMEKRS